jgi:hypothetical protein
MKCENIAEIAKALRAAGIATLKKICSNKQDDRQ